MKQQFPFFARINGKAVKVVGKNHLGLYQVEGFGLHLGPIDPIEQELEPAPISQDSAAIESEPAPQWVRRGYFKQKPLTPKERKLRADSTRHWLQAILREPTPAREVLELARLEGVPLKGLKRAKKRLKITSTRIGGIAWRGRWVWKIPA